MVSNEQLKKEKPINQGRQRIPINRAIEPRQISFNNARLPDESFGDYQLRRMIEKRIHQQLSKSRVVKPMPQSARAARAEFLQAKKLFKRGTFVPPAGSELEKKLWEVVHGCPPPKVGLVLANDSDTEEEFTPLTDLGKHLKNKIAGVFK